MSGKRPADRLNNGAEDSFWLAAYCPPVLQHPFRNTQAEQLKHIDNSSWLGPSQLFITLSRLTKSLKSSKQMVSCEHNADRLHQRTSWSWSASPPSTSWQGSSVQRITFRSCRYAQGRVINGYPGVPCITLGTQCIINISVLIPCWILVLVRCIKSLCVYIHIPISDKYIWYI